MNKWLVAAGITIAAFTNSCSTDFDLNADFQETPVVYGLLDAFVDTQFIRINRAYLSDDVDGLTLAQDPNQIYYGDELEVRMEEYYFGSLINTYPVERVDGDTLGIPKQTGVFANSPNILYRFIADLDYTHSYRLVAENTETGKIITAETSIIDSFAIIRPDDESVFPQSVPFSPNGVYQLRWKTAQDAKIYDLTLRFHYREGIYFPEGDSIHYTFQGYKDWVIERNVEAENIDGGLTITYDVQGSSFFEFITDEFDPVNDFSFVRIADSVQFFIDGGGQELFTYFEYNNATLGITEGQITDAYSNVNGGLGILSSRFHKEGRIYPLSTQARDSIACSSVSSGLNFAPDGGTFGFPYCE
jgi:hypothetical protein